MSHKQLHVYKVLKVKVIAFISAHLIGLDPFKGASH